MGLVERLQPALAERYSIDCEIGRGGEVRSETSPPSLHRFLMLERRIVS
jgi:hypothetical protein